MFLDMKPQSWLNLALAGLATFYLAQIGLDVAWHNLCGHLGVDYCAFWSAGHIANESGYAAMYDIDRLAELEKQLFPAFGDPATFAVSPIAYLPIFMLPFQLLALLPPEPGYWLWTLANLAALAYYLRFFSRSAGGARLQPRLLILMLLSIPVYWNILDGQVNVFLTICIGEFIRSMQSERPFQSGLWLGGLLLKPQNLVLVVPALCLQRSFRSLSGLAASSLVLLAASLALVGRAGFVAMMHVWLGFAQGITTNYVEIMMNWRMLGLHTAALLGGHSGSVIVVIGTAVTSILALYLWRRPIPPRAPFFSVAVLGTIAATATVAWHSHIPSAMMLIPPLLLLEQRRLLPRRAIAYWVFIPAAAYVIALFLAAYMHAHDSAGSSIIATSGSLNFIRGGSEFVLNLWLLYWATRQPAAIAPPLSPKV